MPVSDERFFTCPYCGMENSLLIDFTAGSSQQFVTDCEVCCRPIAVRLFLDGTEVTGFEAVPE